MKIAGIQFSCSKEKDKNLEKGLRVFEMAVREGASIVCFQELFNLPWLPKDRDKKAFSMADEIEGPTVRTMREKARQEKVVIVLPLFLREKSSYYNACIVIDADGELAGIYRKVHLPDIPLWEEKFYFSPGEGGFPVFETSQGKIGLQISWDNLFPEVSRILALKGADIIFAPTSCAFKSQHLWQSIITGNAIANGLYVMRVNRVGHEEVQDFYGMSFCVNPEGDLIGGPTGQGDGVLLAEVDFNYQREVRREWPIMKERRPDLYGEILMKDGIPGVRRKEPV
jgi:N-carbamoylputrescine amidase